MLDRIKDLLGERGGTAPAADGHDAGELRLAAAALLIEAARLDGRFDEVERERITKPVRQRFGLSDAEAVRLFAEAEKAAEVANELYLFTRVI